MSLRRSHRRISCSQQSLPSRVHRYRVYTTSSLSRNTGYMLTACHLICCATLSYRSAEFPLLSDHPVIDILIVSCCIFFITVFERLHHALHYAGCSISRSTQCGIAGLTAWVLIIFLSSPVVQRGENTHYCNHFSSTVQLVCFFEASLPVSLWRPGGRYFPSCSDTHIHNKCTTHTISFLA